LGRRTRRLSLRERELALPLAEALARQADLENPICLIIMDWQGRMQTHLRPPSIRLLKDLRLKFSMRTAMLLPVMLTMGMLAVIVRRFCRACVQKETTSCLYFELQLLAAWM
jgi:hypothetical protein